MFYWTAVFFITAVTAFVIAFFGIAPVWTWLAKIVFFVAIVFFTAMLSLGLFGRGIYPFSNFPKQ